MEKNQRDVLCASLITLKNTCDEGDEVRKSFVVALVLLYL